MDGEREREIERKTGLGSERERALDGARETDIDALYAHTYIENIMNGCIAYHVTFAY